MREMIEDLDDRKALNILATIAATLKEKGYKSEWTLDIGRALQEALQTAPREETVSEGDVARQALLFLAEDPDYREPIRALSRGPAPERFDIGLGIALVPAVLLILQTHVRIKKDKAGKWEILIEKKPTQTNLLKPLVEQLLSWIQGK